MLASFLELGYEGWGGKLRLPLDCALLPQHEKQEKKPLDRGGSGPLLIIELLWLWGADFSVFAAVDFAVLDYFVRSSVDFRSGIVNAIFVLSSLSVFYSSGAFSLFGSASLFSSTILLVVLPLPTTIMLWEGPVPGPDEWVGV